MGIVSKSKEKARFKKLFGEELLEYHLERSAGKDKNNSLPWRTIIEENIQPQADILCDFSNWLLDHGWSKEVVEELFFVVINRKDKTKNRR